MSTATHMAATPNHLHLKMFKDFPVDDIDMLFPDPEDFGIHRLARGLIQGDTCNQATLFKRLLAERIKSECAKCYPAWDTYSDEKRAQIVRTHAGQCWNHLRCIWFGGASKAVGAVVKDDLADDLADCAALAICLHQVGPAASRIDLAAFAPLEPHARAATLIADARRIGVECFEVSP